MTRVQKLAVATVAVTVTLFAVGGLVRGTGSGLGCSTWPGCFPGRLFPTGTIHALIEFSHRALAVAVMGLTGVLAWAAWRDHRHDPKVLIPVLIAFPLSFGQAVIGGIVVLTDLEPVAAVTAHFVTALVLIAVVVIAAVNAFCVIRLPLKGPDAQRSDEGFARVSLAAAATAGVLLLLGTLVRAMGPDTGLAFTDWPLMDGKLLPRLTADSWPMFAHRLGAVVTFSLLLWTFVRAIAMRPRARDLVILSSAALGLFVVQVGIGAANVLTRLQPWAVVLHVAFAVLLWGTLVALATVSRRFAAHTRVLACAVPLPPPPAPERRVPLRDAAGAYVRLTKPRIIVLLLITTIPAMILADRGLPPVWLILATLAGGTLAAGSANSINMYLDRDIDEVMARTRRRPLPAHAVTPERALDFGFLLGATSFVLLGWAVNVLAAVLSTAAIAFYVVVYTMWLKRSTTQNIVVGGAAGAAPALVGWAAVTGTVAAPAWLLFAVVFVWTPPHFWALAMRFRRDYAAAGIPMLPVVKGEDATRRQIFAYSLVLFAVSLLLAPVAHLGPIYLGSALLLGGAFSYRSLVLWRHPTPERAWALFRFSIVYLGALFAAVAVDALALG